MGATLNAYELAKKLKVSHTTIYSWVNQGLPYQTETNGLRHRIVFDLDEVKQWRKTKGVS